MKNYKKVEQGDFVISLRSFQGGIEYSEYEGLVSPAYTVLKNKVEIDDRFYKYLFKKEDFITRLNSVIYGIRDGKQISYKDFKDLKIQYPPITEQKKIASILSTWDKAIELKEKLIEQKKELKKGLMQKLLTGRIRLSGMKIDEFKTYRLNEVLTVKHGKDQKRVEKKNGKYPILGTGGVIGRTDNFLYNKESVLIGRKGTIDRPFYMNTPFWTVDTLFYTEIKKGFFPKYIYYLFNRIPWKKYNEASGVPSLSASTIGSIKVQIPSFEMQKKISFILTELDEEIELLEKLVIEYKQQKKGLMQLLLTGKVRVKV